MAQGDISSGEKALALATKRAIEAAGGLDPCAAETAIGRSQLSRCGSVNERDSISIRDAVTIDMLGQRSDGHPFILRAMCRQMGGVFVPLPEPQDDVGGLALTVDGKMPPAKTVPWAPRSLVVNSKAAWQ